MNVKLVALSMLALTGTCAAASSNTVQFKGEVSTQTCSVNINGNQSNPVVLLPTVAASKLAAKGATAGDTTFTVNVTGCAAATSDTAIKTVLAGNNPTTNGNLGNAGDAAKVSIQLLDSDATTPLSFASGSTVTTSAMTLAKDATSTSQNLVARYYAEDTGVAAGSVIATAQFAISYK
ncbi:fimbrial protein [Serratia marcescens]|uniref:fimbrial protein n=1 Tax=Serratia marcescens TaxID=615 RepID=UPI000E1DF378|nr:fimbrial protein [Serratia marcescens]AXK23701.1 S-fimbrillin [Serratia marcescens]